MIHLIQAQTNNHNILLNLFASNLFSFTSNVVLSIVNLVGIAFYID
jgi:hypothetical protein